MQGHTPASTRRASLVALGALVLTMLGAAPVSAQSEWITVQQQHWFHGHEHDQLHRLDRLAPGSTGLDSRTPTFSEAEPEGETVAQTAFSQPYYKLPQEVGTADAIYWVGPASGEVAGELELSVSLVHQPAVDVQVSVTVYADPDWSAGTGRLLGGLSEHRVRGDLDGAPTTITVPVAGVVLGELVIQVRAQSDIHSGVTVLYGSAEHPSGFTLPLRVPADEG